MEVAEKINENRLASWNRYYKLLSELSQQGKIALPSMPEGCQHNAHMFYIKVADIEERTDLINFLKQKEIISVFHYVPLHSAPAGERFSRFSGEDNFTTQESEKIIRLPLWYGMEEHKVDAVVGAIESYFACNNE